MVGRRWVEKQAERKKSALKGVFSVQILDMFSLSQVLHKMHCVGLYIAVMLLLYCYIKMVNV